MKISIENGYVYFTEDIVIRPGMSYDEVEKMRLNMDTDDIYVSSKKKLMIKFPPANEQQSNLWLRVYFMHEQVCEVDLSVPFKNTLPMSQEEQEEHLIKCVGIEFLDSVFNDEVNGKTNWGKITLRWNWNKGDGVLRLHIIYS